MNSALFFKRREIWLPTLLSVFIAIILLAGASFLTLKNIATFLAKNQPVGSGYLVVEGWLGEPALLEALAVFNKGDYQFMITTGGPDTRQIVPQYPNHAEVAAAFLVKNNFPTSKLVVIPTPASAQDRTYLSAVMVRNWLDKNDSKTQYFDVFSGDVHARRTALLYDMAFNNTKQIGIIAATPNGFELPYWWRTSEGAKSVVIELAGLIWVSCCFYPGELGSHQEKWGIY